MTTTMPLLDLHDLEIHNIDLHYHAGQERQPGQTLADYMRHAQMTGRIIVGVTDHLERYIGIPPAPPEKAPLYAQSVEGLLRFRADVAAVQHDFPVLKLFFGPEIHASPRIDLAHIPAEIMAASDYFLCALPGVENSCAENTAARLAWLPRIRDLADRSGKPVFIAHPFRSSVDHQLVRRDIEPWITALRPRRDGSFQDDELNAFFRFDVRALARACREYGLPIEVNGGTVGRIRGVNLAAPLQMLWAAYRLFRDAGVDLVPGSDQHAYMLTPTRREGRYVPYDAFAALDITAADIGLVQRLLHGAALPQEERTTCC